MRIHLLFVIVLLTGTAYAQWSSAVLEPVSTGPEKDLMSRSTLAVDALGGVHLLFDRIPGPSDHDFYYTRRSGNGDWSAPVPVGDHGATLATPFLAVHEPSGTPYVVYIQDGLLKLGVAWSGVWTYYDLTTPPFDGLYWPAVAVDDFGCAHVAVIEWSDGMFKMCYGLWDGPVSSQFHFQILEDSELGDYGSGAAPDLCVRSDGSVAISYRGGGYLGYRIDVAENASLGGTVWDIQAVDVPAHDCYSSSVKATPNDDLHLAFHGNMGFGLPAYVFYTSKEEGAPAWEPVVTVSGMLKGGDVKMAVEPDGTAHIVFQEVSGNFYTGNICYTSNSSGAWQAEYLLKGDKLDPSLGMDREGNGSLAFEQYVTSTDWDIYYYGFTAAPALDCDVFTLSAGTGGTVNLSLDAGSACAGRMHLILSGVTGTKPGFTLPDGLTTLPLNWDVFTDVALGLLNTSVFFNFLGTLDGTGKSTAQINAPPLPPVAVGVKMFYAYCLNSPFDFASNPVSIEIIP